MAVLRYIGRFKTLRRRLRLLARQLVLAERDQRLRVAGELHDHVGQSLALIRLKLRGIQQAALRDLAQDLRQVQDLLEEAIRETRALAFRMSSPALDADFPTAMEALARSFQAEHGIEIEFKASAGTGTAARSAWKKTDEAARVFVFEAARELLHNVAKHAQARHVRLHVRHLGETLRLYVADDGIGFDPKTFGNCEGFGLFNLRERARALGGRLRLRSERGVGTRILLVIPAKGDK